MYDLSCFQTNRNLDFVYNPMIKPRLFLFLFLFLSLSSVSAKIKYALVGINGLTCSACSYATEKSIRKLDFVQDVKIELNSNVATITFVQGKSIDLDALAQKVKDAAFSVRNINLVLELDSVKIESETLLQVDRLYFRFLQVKPQELKGEVNVRLIGRKFMSKAEYKPWEKTVEQHAKSVKQKEYYVTF